eukprot:TRINITY_DN989_c0_g1_i1.p1 TRINITY_DN989_c0_g1~~TRINITY_DN989_c0_g1_i1.p1  ORF type:complete len:298 (+),score=116.84 TRINITY_DN989_c0_g1_i1:95-988(+)
MKINLKKVFKNNNKFTYKGFTKKTSLLNSKYWNQTLFYSTTEYKNIIATKKDGYSIIQLNRPKALNALNNELITELNQALVEYDKDPSVGCIILTGSEKAFAAGADIKEMATKEFVDIYNGNMFSTWDDLTKIGKPIIAAVSGFALGGGCELAMMTDIIVAADNAQFGQPEIKLGTIPGVGGTQRLTRLVGKSKAMELVLTGDFISAQEARDFGLVTKVVPLSELMPTVEKMAKKISSMSQPIVKMAKECVNQSYESTLREGIHFERRLFQSSFATKDQKEGMDAFVNKRPPNFTNK